MAIILASLVGSQKWMHELDHSHSDKEIAPIHEVQFSDFFPTSVPIADSLHAQGGSTGWIVVKKKKGKRDFLPSTQ